MMESSRELVPTVTARGAGRGVQAPEGPGAKVADDGVILTQAQVVALESKPRDNEASGQVETEHQNCIGLQNTSTCCAPAPSPRRFRSAAILPLADAVNPLSGVFGIAKASLVVAERRLDVSHGSFASALASRSRQRVP